MLDLDFLANAKPSIRNNIVFTGDSLALWPQTFTKLRTLLTNRGFSIATLPMDGAIASLTTPSLFQTNCYVANLNDWFDADKKVALTTLDALGRMLTNNPGLLDHHFILYGAAEYAEAEWFSAITPHATHLEEVKLSKNALGKVYSFLEYRYPEVARLHPSSKVDFERMLTELLTETDQTLPNLLNRIDLIVVICISDEPPAAMPAGAAIAGKEVEVHAEKRGRRKAKANLTESDDPTQNPDATYFIQQTYTTLFASKAGLEYDHWHNLLSNFLTHQDAQRADQLFAAIDQGIHQYGLSNRGIYATLLRVTDEFFYVNQLLGGIKPENFSDYRWQKLQAFKNIAPRVLFMWNNYLLMFMPTLLTKSHTNWLSLFQRMLISK